MNSKHDKIYNTALISFLFLFIATLNNSIFLNQIGYFGALLLIVFKSVKKKPNSAKKGSLKDNYFEATFKSDYLDIVEFLKEVQLYDVMLIPLCLEINSQEKVLTSSSDKIEEKDSIIIPLNKEGVPLVSNDELDIINKNPDLGKVETKIVFKIPSFNK